MGTIGTFETLRPHLMAVAYRMLGSAADAEDAVQDAWLRWRDVDEAGIVTPKAWLSTTLGRICLDRLTSAYARRKTYVGPWLPEPVATLDPVDTESISQAFLLVLERLSPLERVVFILHRVFDYSHAEIAAAIASTDAAVRQAFHRAQQHVSDARPRFAVDRGAHERLLRGFLGAVSRGDVQAISDMLVEDATACGDSGGKVRGAGLKQIHGKSAIARFFIGVTTKFMSTDDFRFDVRLINGWPACVIENHDGVFGVIQIETDGEHIFAVRNVINPDKLKMPRVD
jgi:RNA polymerase sigma-70 factor (ECF subfamily)